MTNGRRVPDFCGRRIFRMIAAKSPMPQAICVAAIECGAARNVSTRNTKLTRSSSLTGPDPSPAPLRRSMYSKNAAINASIIAVEQVQEYV